MLQLSLNTDGPQIPVISAETPRHSDEYIHRYHHHYDDHHQLDSDHCATSRPASNLERIPTTCLWSLGEKNSWKWGEQKRRVTWYDMIWYDMIWFWYWCCIALRCLGCFLFHYTFLFWFQSLIRSCWSKVSRLKQTSTFCEAVRLRVFNSRCARGQGFSFHGPSDTKRTDNRHTAYLSLGWQRPVRSEDHFHQTCQFLLVWL